MLFSYSVIYRAIASEPLFGQFLTACCSEIDPSPYRCVRCLLEDLCTTMVDTIERSTPKSKADRSNIIETRYKTRTFAIHVFSRRGTPLLIHPIAEKAHSRKLVVASLATNIPFYGAQSSVTP